ncbi:hypothetical protein PENSOL_c042G08620 [Penicillium solitum]|uniref:RNase H type-1 domain-containing protein n=1 Tax=Penicillium solitum TaxID=60172 RepID=A0A1V6QTP3_9EURO|nr:uncharacterized protein PENSOL_c042G08620 [Penicillium solitum]OQD92322.1 hypothetical protein PENSOL_c042G08620 [Penicillium solitum]
MTLCIDSTSVIWCVRGNASDSSQWAFLRCHEAMNSHDISIGIQSNEEVDRLADEGARSEPLTEGHEARPTVSGIRSIFRKLRKSARQACDFDWYHRRFNHIDAKLTYSCGRNKSPQHIALYRKTKSRFSNWPDRPALMPSGKTAAIRYLTGISPADFALLIQLTEFYSVICTR